MIDHELSQELRQFFKLLNEERSKPSPPPAKYAFLNSPFVVTVIGGLVLSLLSLKLQARAANERELAQQRATDQREHSARMAAVWDKKYTLMSEFAFGMTLYLQHAPEVKTRSIFIAENAGSEFKGTLTFDDGRGWKETVEKYETSLAYLNTLKCPDAYCAQAAATFATQQLLLELGELDSLMDKYAETNSSDEFESLTNLASAKLQSVIRLMGTELKEPRSK
jgi:hypothetical protein